MLQLPISTDLLNAPDHAFSHRVFVVDDAALEQSVVVDSTGRTNINGTFNFLQSGGIPFKSVTDTLANYPINNPTDIALINTMDGGIGFAYYGSEMWGIENNGTALFQGNINSYSTITGQSVHTYGVLDTSYNILDDGYGNTTFYGNVSIPNTNGGYLCVDTVQSCTVSNIVFHSDVDGLGTYNLTGWYSGALGQLYTHDIQPDGTAASNGYISVGINIDGASIYSLNNWSQGNFNTVNASNIYDSSLTNGRVVTSSSGTLNDSANLTFDGSMLTIGGGANIKLTGGTTSGHGNIQFCANASNSYDSNVMYLDSTAKTGGFVFGSTPGFLGSNGPYFGGRGNTFSALAGQRGFIFISAGNPTTPTGIEGGFGIYTNDTIRLFAAYTGGIIIGATTGNANAILDVQSTTKAFMPPRMTTTQRNAISGITEGMVVYNTTTHTLQTYNGTSWI